MLEELIYLLQVSINHEAYYWGAGMRRGKENLPPHIKAKSLQKCFPLLKTFFFFFFSFTKANNGFCIPVRTLLWPPHNQCWAFQVALVVKNPSINAGNVRDHARSLGHEDPLEEGMATHSRILAWRIPWTVALQALLSMGLHRIRHDWNDTHTQYKWSNCSHVF